MKECQSSRDVEDEFPDLGFRHLSDLTADRAILAIGHNEVRTVLEDIEVVDVEQVGMMKFVGNLKFIAKLLQSLLVKNAIEFDGHIDISQQVMSQPDIPKTTVT